MGGVPLNRVHLNAFSSAFMLPVPLSSEISYRQSSIVFWCGFRCTIAVAAHLNTLSLQDECSMSTMACLAEYVHDLNHESLSIT